MVFHGRLSDSKSPQVSRTLLSILAVFNNAVVWMVPTRPPTSKSSRPFNNHLVTVPKAPITIGIIVTFIFHSFFNSLARPRYLLLLLLLLIFIFIFIKIANHSTITGTLVEYLHACTHTHTHTHIYIYIYITPLLCFYWNDSDLLNRFSFYFVRFLQIEKEMFLSTRSCSDSMKRLFRLGMISFCRYQFVITFFCRHRVGEPYSSFKIICVHVRVRTRMRACFCFILFSSKVKSDQNMLHC